jgi:tRNA U34 5-methylaminomethyl-2-thiouridine-forming methyltransferase MnmC
MAELQVEHIITKDGSSTLYSPRFNEHYHSVHGAIQESMHVFIRMGLEAIRPFKKEVSILEMGFGTGLNALLTLLYAQDLRIQYTGIESDPVPLPLVQTLNYPEELKMPEAQEPFLLMHQVEWNQPVVINEQFVLAKCHCKLQEFEASQPFDLVYFDAFAPNAQPELWEDEIWVKLYDLMADGGVFVTYSAKSSVRRGLQSAGFDVEKLPGPPGKREMLRAQKK